MQTAILSVSKYQNTSVETVKYYNDKTTIEKLSDLNL